MKGLLLRVLGLLMIVGVVVGAVLATGHTLADLWQGIKMFSIIAIAFVIVAIGLWLLSGGGSDEDHT